MAFIKRTRLTTHQLANVLFLFKIIEKKIVTYKITGHLEGNNVLPFIVSVRTQKHCCFVSYRIGMGLLIKLLALFDVGSAFDTVDQRSPKFFGRRQDSEILVLCLLSDRYGGY